MIGKLPAVACAAALLVAASSAAAEEAEYTNIHTIAVASAIGHDYLLFHEGITIFDTSREKMDISDWGINAWMTDAITKALASRFTIKQVPLDQAALDKCDGRDQCTDLLPHRDDVDAYVIAIKRSIPLANPKNDLWGIGQLHNPGPFGLHVDEIHTAYEIDVVDAKTGHVIDHGAAKLTAGSLLFADDPIVGKLPESAWPETAAQMTDDQKAFARKTVMDLLVKSLPYGLTNANLIPGPEDHK